MNKIIKNFNQIKRRLSWMFYRKNKINNAKLTDLINDGMKLHLCCGDKKYNGYVNIDVVALEGVDLVMDVTKDLHQIPSDIAFEIVIESGLEHFYKPQQSYLLRECYRILKSGGKLNIKWIPDFEAVVNAYINKKTICGKPFDLKQAAKYLYGDYKNNMSHFEIHKDLFTKDTVQKLFIEYGFKVEKIENELFPGEDVSVTMNIVGVK